MFICVLRGRKVYGGIATTLALVAGCGGDSDYANNPRPPAPINVTAAITNSKVSVSPQRFGAGPIVLIVSNQSSRAQEVTFETDELGGSRARAHVLDHPDQPARDGVAEGRRPAGQLEARHQGRRRPRRRPCWSGKKRDSAQNDLLQP